MNYLFKFYFALVFSCVNAKPAWFINEVDEVSNNEPLKRQSFSPHFFYPVGMNSQYGDIVIYDGEISQQPPSPNGIQETDMFDRIIFGPRSSSTTIKTPVVGDESSDNINDQSQPGIELTSTSRPDRSTSTVSSINGWPAFPPGTVNACQRKCMRSGVTSEYNPLCGSDGVTYSNPGKVLCAQKCGKNIKTRSGNCGTTSPQV